jgi:uncharacterized SAM-binding protein YcdF (DUF218 family)
MIPFGLKKFISQFLMPMPLVCECLLAGFILTRFTRYKKTGQCFYVVAFSLFLAFGYGFGRTYLSNLERQYPPFNPTPGQCEELRGTPIVVLGQGMPEKSDLPVRYQNNPVFERRLFEGVRVAKLIPDSHLIVSMAGAASDRAKQVALDDYLHQLSFSTNRVAMFTTARDTPEEAKLAKQAVEKCANARMLECANGAASQVSNPPTNALTHARTNERANFSTLELSNFRTNGLILATSASHIPRSMRIFQKQGFAPIAAPCDFTQLGDDGVKIEWYKLPFPSERNFEYSTTAVYEWLGGCYERMTRK